MTTKGETWRGREGDLVELHDGSIFEVKGLVHPPRGAIAYVRYVPDEAGDRHRLGRSYTKISSLGEKYGPYVQRYSQFFVNDPFFNTLVCVVGQNDIAKHYDPQSHLKALCRGLLSDPLEDVACQLARLLSSSSGVAFGRFGISGSLLAGLHLPSSDIDLTVYGIEACKSVRLALKPLLDEGSYLKRHDMESLKGLFKARSEDTIMGFDAFKKHEMRKSFQGTYRGHDFFIRYIKDWSEVTERYGDFVYQNLGQAKISGVVADDSESIFTPCRYLVEDVHIVRGSFHGDLCEIASFRSRFCEQARAGERFMAKGKLERVSSTLHPEEEHLRLILGERRRDNMQTVEIGEEA